MTGIIITQDQLYQKPDAGTIIGGVLAGGVVKGMSSKPAEFASPKIIEKMKEISSGITQGEFAQVESAIKKTINSSGLKNKGVSIIKPTVLNSDEINKIMEKEVNRGLLKYLPEKLKSRIGDELSSQIASGNNAVYTFASKKIIMPKKDLGLAVFHEAGHAMNANLSHIGKALQKCRSLTLLALPISLIALFKTKKAPGEKPKNKVDKVTTFIKENAGKLTFATFLPTLIEEGMATLKGNRAAKKLLSPELAKKVARTNALGYSSYLLLAALSGLGIYLGTKVKDAIAKPKPINNI